MKKFIQYLCKIYDTKSIYHYDVPTFKIASFRLLNVKKMLKQSKCLDNSKKVCIFASLNKTKEFCVTQKAESFPTSVAKADLGINRLKYFHQRFIGTQKYQSQSAPPFAKRQRHCEWTDSPHVESRTMRWSFPLLGVVETQSKNVEITRFSGNHTWRSETR